MAVLNWKQVYDLNSTTTFNANDVFYLARSPYGVGDDFGFLYSSLVPITTKGDLFTFSTANARLGVGANGTLLTPDSTTATGLKWTTATYPATTTINQVLYSSAANVVSGIATSNAAVFVTDSGGVPLTSYQLPIGVMQNITTVGTVAAGTWQGNTIGTGYGGTGTSTTFTLGSVVYAGTGGVYEQDNAEFFWDNTNKTLGVGTATPNSAAKIHIEVDGGTTDVGLFISNFGFGAGWGSLYRPSNDTTLLEYIRFDNSAGTEIGNIYRYSSTQVGFNGVCNYGTHLIGGGANQIPYQTAVDTTSFIAAGTQYQVLTAGATGVPGFGHVNLAQAAAVTGILSLSNGGTGTSTTFTEGSIVFAGASGVYSQDNANLFWDNGNNRLGIGTATPATSLDVVGSVKASASGGFGAAGTYAIPTDQGAWIAWNRLVNGATTFANQRGIGAGGWDWANYDNTNTLTNVPMALSSSGDLSIIGSITGGAWTSTVIGMTYGGTGANLTPSDGAIVYTTATEMALLASPALLNKVLLSSSTGAPHWSDASFPDATATGYMLVGTGTNIWAGLAPSASTILSCNGSSAPTWISTVPVANGGTGTTTAFTAGSVVFAGASGVYSQDNTNFFWDDTNNRLGLGTSSPSQTLDVKGIFNIYDTSKTYAAGIATEQNSSLINYGINDIRFGTPQSDVDQGGVIRVDTRAGQHVIQIFTRSAGSATSTPVLRITSDGDILFGPGSLATTATLGFPFMPSCAGTPTGTPTSYAGAFIPFIYDLTNNNLKLYNSGWKDPVGNLLSTWTPVMGDGTNNFTLTTAKGTYTRIGNFIEFWVQVVWTSIGSASGVIQITLPTTLSASMAPPSFSIGFSNGVTATGGVLTNAAAGTSQILFYDYVSGSAALALTNTAFAASGELQISGSYYSA